MIDKLIMEIIVFRKNGRRIIRYDSTVIPHIGDTLEFPHHGSFIVTKVIHYIFDDAPDYENNKQGWVEVYVEKRK